MMGSATKAALAKIGMFLIVLGLFLGDAAAIKALAANMVFELYGISNGAIKMTGIQSQWMMPKSDALVQAGLKSMNTVHDEKTGETLNQLIDRITGADAIYMKAIAIHESSGGLIKQEKGGGALCAFQIDPGTLPDVARANGMTTQQASAALMNSLEFCVKAGYFIWQQKKDKAGGNIDLAHCYYNGQMSALRGMGGDKCWASMEYKVMEAVIRDGAVIVTSNPRKDQPGLSEITIKTLSGEVIGHSLNCQDHTTMHLAQAFAKMADSYRIYTSEVRERTYVQGTQASMSANTHRFQFNDLWCIGDLQFSLDNIRNLMSPLNMYSALFARILTGLLNNLCNYVVSAVRAAVDTIMNSICLALPDLTFSMSLPSLKKKSCNGVPLGQAMLVNGSGFPADKLNDAILNGLDGIPGINGLPTLQWESPSLAGPLRAIFGSPQGSQQGSSP